MRVSKLPLILSVKRGSGSWRQNDVNIESADEEFKNIRSDVLQKSRFACKFCDFTCSTHQHAHHKDDNHRNNTPINLVCACAYCHQCHHIGHAGVTGENALIYFPERNQVWVNHMARLYFVSRLYKPNEYTEKIAKIYNYVKNVGMKNMLEVFGKTQDDFRSTDPLWLANFLMSLDNDAYSQRMNWGVKFNSIRLLPLKDNDKARLQAWKKALLPAEDWGFLMNDIDNMSI